MNRPHPGPKRDPRTRSTGWGHATLSVLLALLLATSWATVAAAHTSVVTSSTPSDGTEVDRVEFIELRFATAVKPDMAGYALTVDGGTAAALGPAVYGSGNTSVRFRVADPLPHGQYRLAYQLVVAQDNHPATGWIGFRVGPFTVRPGTPTATETAPAMTTPPGTGGPAGWPITGWVLAAAAVTVIVVVALIGRRRRHQN